MKLTIRQLRQRIREDLGINNMIGYPFGNPQLPPEELAGSMPWPVDHPVLPVEAQDVDDVDGLDLSIFDDDDELFLPVLNDPYVRDTFRNRFGG